MIRITRTKGLKVLAISTVALVGISLLMKRLPIAVPVIIFWAGLQSMATFCALLWALPLSNNTFLSVFVGDALVRFGSVGVIAALLNHFRIPCVFPLGALVMAYVLLSLLQIPFLHKAA